MPFSVDLLPLPLFILRAVKIPAVIELGVVDRQRAFERNRAIAQQHLAVLLHLAQCAGDRDDISPAMSAWLRRSSSMLRPSRATSSPSRASKMAMRSVMRVFASISTWANMAEVELTSRQLRIFSR